MHSNWDVHVCKHTFVNHLHNGSPEFSISTAELLISSNKYQHYIIPFCHVGSAVSSPASNITFIGALEFAFGNACSKNLHFSFKALNNFPGNFPSISFRCYFETGSTLRTISVVTMYPETNLCIFEWSNSYSHIIILLFSTNFHPLMA